MEHSDIDVVMWVWLSDTTIIGREFYGGRMCRFVATARLFVHNRDCIKYTSEGRNSNIALCESINLLQVCVNYNRGCRSKPNKEGSEDAMEPGVVVVVRTTTHHAAHCCWLAKPPPATSNKYNCRYIFMGGELMTCVTEERWLFFKKIKFLGEFQPCMLRNGLLLRYPHQSTQHAYIR